jgi:Dolichyl-phosphate-mannose-protein mannosyltransferase
MTSAASAPLQANWRFRFLALVLVFVSVILRFFYLANHCPLDLAPDEAHYWDWSRHLDWSYYSKGPLVAYLIRAGCLVAGSWSQQLIGNEMLAVRLPAILCGVLLLASLYVLTVQVYGRESLALAVVAIALTLPVVAAGASLMTIDAPYTCCWGWALVLGHRAVFRQSWWTWPLLGLTVGAGILAKYTMVLWLPSVMLFLLSNRCQRALLLQPGPWLACALAALCCLPIILWNYQHDWVSLRHVNGQAGLDQGSGWRWSGPLEYVAVQCSLLLVVWFVAWVAAMVARNPWARTDPGTRYLWWLSAPMFAVFLVFGFRTRGEPNWPIAAYLSGLVLTAAWSADQLRSASTWRQRLSKSAAALGCCIGLVVTIVMYHSSWAHPLLAKLVSPPSETRPLPLRRLDPTCRLRGWRTLAAAVDCLADDLRAHGGEPLIAGSSWTLPGELSFYCRGHPTVYSLGLALGDRHSQYDLWQPNPVADAAAFAGRTFIYVGEGSPLLETAFQKVEPPQTVVYKEAGQPLAQWKVRICRGFRGFSRQTLAPGAGPSY